MAEATDIRHWARERGHDIGERGRIPKDLQAQYDAEINERADLNGDISVSLPDDLDTGEVPPRPFTSSLPPSPSGGSSTSPATSSETPPQAKKRRMPWQPKPPAGGQPKPARPAYPRVPLETWAARIWKFAGKMLGDGQTPSSRCVYMQAPVAGVIIDAQIKDTFIDRFAQPIARTGERGKNLGALVGLPLLVALTERQPQLYEYTRPVMVAAAEEWVLIAGPAMRKAKKRAADIAKELAEFEFDEDENLFASAPENPAIARMLDAIFAPMMQQQPEPEPAAA